MQKRKWAQQEEETLIRLYEDPKVFPKDIAKMLGRTLPQVYNKARAMGLRAPIERLQMAGKIGAQQPKSIATRFHKGRIPDNTYEEIYDTILCDDEFNALYRQHGQKKVKKPKR